MLSFAQKSRIPKIFSKPVINLIAEYAGDFLTLHRIDRILPKLMKVNPEHLPKYEMSKMNFCLPQKVCVNDDSCFKFLSDHRHRGWTIKVDYHLFPVRQNKIFGCFSFSVYEFYEDEDETTVFQEFLDLSPKVKPYNIYKFLKRCLKDIRTKQDRCEDCNKFIIRNGAIPFLCYECGEVVRSRKRHKVF